jgi:hypothetical protein
MVRNFVDTESLAAMHYGPPGLLLDGFLSYQASARTPLDRARITASPRQRHRFFSNLLHWNTNDFLTRLPEGSTRCLYVFVEQSEPR